MGRVCGEVWGGCRWGEVWYKTGVGRKKGFSGEEVERMMVWEGDGEWKIFLTFFFFPSLFLLSPCFFLFSLLVSLSRI